MFLLLLFWIIIYFFLHTMRACSKMIKKKIAIINKQFDYKLEISMTRLKLVTITLL